MSVLENTSCLSDRPIDLQADTLGNNRYARGLNEFIRHADTPVTIGIQGGWGSGKTSLINILQHQLEKQGDSLCIFINAWEHSLFQSENDKSGVAISLLSGVVEAICSVIEGKSKVLNHDGSPQISEEVRFVALREDSALQKVGKFAVGLAALSARIGAKFVADIEVPSNEKDGDGNSRLSGARFIRDLRRDLTHAVQTVSDKTPYKRFVCFIDDLDRVHPKTAIEILDVLKNVFDVPNCVFVLAIDFEVVVKGLEDKFGKKTAENEREFRQYFDKIIQVPFAMPVSAYAGKMEQLLAVHFSALHLDAANLARMADVAWAATDGIPRGVKRIVNTLSLLLRIREQAENSEEKRAISPEYLETMFIVVALQIHFPEIYRKLAERPNFTEWTFDDLNRDWDLIFKGIDSDFVTDGGQFDPDALATEHGESFDEDWEQVVYLLCQRSAWLKQKAVSVSGILNRLNEVQSACEGESGSEFLRDALEAVNVTDVDGREVVRDEGDGPRSDYVTQFFQSVHKDLIVNLSDAKVKLRPMDPVRLWAKQPGGGRTRRYDIDDLGSNWFGGVSLNWRDGLSAIVSLKPRHGRTQDFRLHVENNRPSYFNEGNSRDYWVAEIAGYESIEALIPSVSTDVAKKVAGLILDMKRSAIDSFK